MKTDHAYWRNVWTHALANVPKRTFTYRIGADPEGHAITWQAGQWAAVARCLDLPLYSTGGHFNGHNRVFANWRRGSKPRDPETTRKLLLLASSIGPALAKFKLKELGLAKRYNI